MAERCVKGDYIGFTFGGVHSSELGLVRVSNGSRYEQDLLPPLQDKTAQVSGRDGVIYFNSQYNTKPIKVPVAFDNMTEETFQKLKELIMDKKPKYLWFDETPYKQWLVKAGGLQSFKWVCFDESKNIDRLDDRDSEGTKKRIYKGEGTLEFVCFTPYAESRVTFLDQTVDKIMSLQRHRIIINNFEESGFRSLICFKIVNNDNKNLPLGESMTYYPLQLKNGVILDENYQNLSNEEILKKYKQERYELLYRMWFNTGVAYGTPFIWDSANHGIPKLNIQIYVIQETDNILQFNTVYNGYDFNHFQDTPIEISSTSTLYNYNLFNILVNGEKVQQAFIFIETKNKNLYPLNIKDDQLFVDYNRKIMLLTGLPINLQQNYNYSEWNDASKLRYYNQDGFNYDTFYSTLHTPESENNYYSYEAKIYNAGDEFSNIYITWNGKVESTFTEKVVIKPLTIVYYKWENNEKKEEVQRMELKQFELQSGDAGLIFDSKLKMIKGVNRFGKVTGNTYNKYHKSGDFFKLPPCDSNEYYSVEISIEDTEDNSTKYSIEHKHYYI